MNNNKTQFDDKDIFEHDGYRLAFARTKYTSNNSTAIEVIIVDDNNTPVEDFGSLSINLEDYGIINTEKAIAINHDFMIDSLKPIVDEFIGRYGTGKTLNIIYGYASSIFVEIKEISELKELIM